MPIDAAKATSAEPRTTELAWDHKDVQLYHLGIGAGAATAERPHAATDPDELRYTLESALHVLPSFATVAGLGSPLVERSRELGEGMALAGGLSAPGIDVDLAAVLHGGQTVTVHRPLPVHGRATQTSTVPAVYDKGKAAVIVLRSEVADGDGPLWTCDTQIFVRGEGGFGGERGPSVRGELPDRAPDLTTERLVRADQALLYRLSGDWNPLHADPEFAALAGFDRPILHGLCSYGVTLKAVVDTVLDGDVTRVRAYSTRFAGVVFPGETLRIRVWRDVTEGGNSEPGQPGSDGRLQVSVTAADRDDAPVLADTVVAYR
ncbi:MaoC/PaaZ C-terminal domain-containing protein [Streptomyces sp. NPDC057555]|uniref:MaoC/PaaZ C-terminal domain-containing protein n=1 Tax=Streptomyces sp. NPDC057555 TaxID=3346166 RepID=UPI0036777730